MDGEDAGQAGSLEAPTATALPDPQKEVRVLDLDTPHQKYFTQDGQLVPGGSTIAGIGDDKSGMVHVAWKLGKEGKDYKKEWKRASTIGSGAHFLIEGFLVGFEADITSALTEDEQKIAHKVFDKFLEKWKGLDLEFIASELQLVSEVYRYGGTLDIVCKRRTDGRKFLLDIKSSKGIYTSYLCQLASYEKLYNENNDEPLSGRAIWRLGKGNVLDQEVAWLTHKDVETYFRKFLKKLALYYDDYSTGEAQTSTSSKQKARGRK